MLTQLKAETDAQRAQLKAETDDKLAQLRAKTEAWFKARMEARIAQNNIELRNMMKEFVKKYSKADMLADASEEAGNVGKWVMNDDFPDTSLKKDKLKTDDWWYMMDAYFFLDLNDIL